MQDYKSLCEATRFIFAARCLTKRCGKTPVYAVANIAIFVYMCHEKRQKTK